MAVIDKEVLLNTGQESKAKTISPLINGELLAVIIVTGLADITIRSANYPGVVLFKRLNVIAPGGLYVPLVVEQDEGKKEPDRRTKTASRYFLNEPLIVEVEGRKDTEVSVSFRYREIK